MKVLLLDNYDSFTWNLVHGLECAGACCRVCRSDAITLEEVENFAPDRIVLSPGPFGPTQAGICGEVVEHFREQVPILGVCLGMQVIASVMGARVIPSGQPKHGKASPVLHDGKGIFRSVPNPFSGARYHSLIVVPDSLPRSVKVSAWSPQGEVLGCRVEGTQVEGILFHPESFLTQHSARLFSNFLEA